MMSSWIVAPIMAAMASTRKEKSTPEHDKKIRVLYEKRVKVPASSYYADDFEIDTAGNGFSVVPTRVYTAPEHTLYAIVKDFDSIEEAKPFLVIANMVMRAVSFQERTNDGEWDGLWQELKLSIQGEMAADRAERELKVS